MNPLYRKNAITLTSKFVTPVTKPQKIKDGSKYYAALQLIDSLKNLFVIIKFQNHQQHTRRSDTR